MEKEDHSRRLGMLSASLCREWKWVQDKMWRLRTEGARRGLGLQEVECLPSREPWVWSSAPHKPGVVDQAYISPLGRWRQED